MINLSSIHINLDYVLNRLNLTKNKLAVEAKLRPNLIGEMTEGKTKAIKLETLATLLDTLNMISIEQGDDLVVTVGDILVYVPDDPSIKKRIIKSK